MRLATAQLVADYGHDVTSAEGARAHLREIRPRPPVTRRSYVGICRALAGDRLADGRLVEVGWGHETPTQWVGGRLAAFLEYWEKAAVRPTRVGSPYNPDPTAVYRAWRCGLPPLVARAGRWLDRGPLHRRSPGEIRREVRIARAARRASVRASPDGHLAIGRGALERLGRLSPEAQAIVLAASGYGPRHTASAPLGASALRWDRSAAQVAALGVPRVRVARLLLGGDERVFAPHRVQRASALAGVPTFSLEPWLAPAFPSLSLGHAAKIALGSSPRDLAPGLTAAEAHDWALGLDPRFPAGSADVGGWLAARLSLPRHRSVAVVRWLDAVRRRGAWGQLTRERVAHGPAGRARDFTFLDLLDEIDDIDLRAGSRPEDVFRAASERLYAAMTSTPSEDLLAEPPPWAARAERRYPRAIRVLSTEAALVREGQEQGHCVGGYAPAVRAQQCTVLALRAGPHRSTAEVSRDGSRVYQHYGANNGPAHPALERLLTRLVGTFRR